MKTALILVGGFGTRLKTVFPDQPKPLVPIAGKPFLDLILTRLSRQKFERVILLCHYERKLFDFYLTRGHEFSLQIEISEESIPLGSAGAFRLAVEKFALEGQILLVNGDTLVNDAYEAVQNSKPGPGELASIGVRFCEDGSRYGVVSVDTDNHVLRFEEKMAKSSGLVYTGVCLLDCSLAREVPVNKFYSLEQDLFPSLLASGRKINAVPVNDNFYDIGLPSSYAALNADQIFARQPEKSALSFLLLQTLLEGGKLLSVGPVSFADFASETPVCSARKLEETNLENLGPADLLVLTEPSQTDLIYANGCSATRIAIISDKLFSENLYDSLTHPSQVGAQKGIASAEWKNLKISRGLFVRHGNECLRPALFLDRDGVVVEHVHYLRDAEEVILKKNISKLISRAHDAGFFVVLITNQSGIGREIIPWTNFYRVQNRMMERLASEGCWIDLVMVAPFHRSSQRSFGLLGQSLRKPRGGMLTLAARDHQIDLSKSVMVGDRGIDMLAAHTAGVKNRYLIQSDEFQKENEATLENIPFSVVHDLDHVVLP